MKIKEISKTAIILLAVALGACGGGESTAEKTKEESVVSAEPAESTPPVVSTPKEDSLPEQQIAAENSLEISGEEKIANSDCLSCHYKDRQVIGPAFLDIAAEYDNNEENVALLVEKVIKGGAGVWGEVAMPPHATLSEEDAKDMVEYILSLGN
jgi:cytochrome c